MASDANQNIVTEVIGELTKVVHEARKAPVAIDSFLRFSLYLERLRPILHQWNCGKVPQLPLRVQTALSGIRVELLKFQGPLQTCKSKSRLYLLTHCQEVVKEIQKSTHGVGICMAQLSLSKSASHVQESPMLDVGKKVDDLAREMQQAQFTVSASEERICLALEREAQAECHSDSQSAILVDIGLELGLDLHRNPGALFEQLQLLRRELVDCRDLAQILLLETIECLFQSWTHEPAGVPHWHAIAAESAEDDPLTPFDNFLCPLTKQIMKDPVFLQSGRTYERSAIENWFSSCEEEGRKPSCPVSGQILTSSELQPSLVLRQTIQEWKHRNVGIRIRLATTRLGPTASSKETEHALEEVVLMAKDSAVNRRKLLEAGFIDLVLGVWQRNGRSRAHHLRTGSIAALRSMAIGSQENKHVMVEMGAIKLAVQSLGSGAVEKEKQFAVALLHEFSLSPALCTRIGADAIVALIDVTSGENVEVCKLADEALGNLDKVDANALQMAKAGRMQPVLTRLCQGPEATQVELAQHLSHMILTDTSKEAVAETGGKTLVRMLSVSPDAREAALGALFNLSTLDGTTDALVKAGAITHLLFTIFSLPAPTNLKESAVCTLANLVLVPGSWEDSIVGKDGHFLHSEKVLHKFLDLLQIGSSLWKEKILQILYSMACSHQVAGVVAANIGSCGGSMTLMTFITHYETNTRLNAMRLLSLLSVHIGDDIAVAIRCTLKLKYLKEVLQVHRKVMLEEYIAAATILANTPLTEFEVIRVLEVEMLQWTVTTLESHKTGQQQQQQRGHLSRRTEYIAVQEALIGILLHFARNSNFTILNTMREAHVFSIFQENLMADWTPLIKERSALGLQHLSQRAHLFHSPHSQAHRRGITLLGLCVFPSKSQAMECAVHGGSCTPNGTFCLVAAGAVAVLIRLVKKEDDYGVREAAMGALSTLLADNVDLKRGVDELVRGEGVQPMFDLLYSIRQGRLQEKAVWVVERILRVQGYAERYASDPGLHKGLTEAVRYGGPNTCLLAQQALASLHPHCNSTSQ